MLELLSLLNYNPFLVQCDFTNRTKKIADLQDGADVPAHEWSSEEVEHSFFQRGKSLLQVRCSLNEDHRTTGNYHLFELGEVVTSIGA